MITIKDNNCMPVCRLSILPPSGLSIHSQYTFVQSHVYIASCIEAVGYGYKQYLYVRTVCDHGYFLDVIVV